jgi:hypothetical protein
VSSQLDPKYAEAARRTADFIVSSHYSEIAGYIRDTILVTKFIGKHGGGISEHGALIKIPNRSVGAVWFSRGFDGVGWVHKAAEWVRQQHPPQAKEPT